MKGLLKISWLNVKNIAYSKKFMLGISIAFIYSMMWVFLVRPSRYGLSEYAFEIGRFLFIVILYSTVSLLRNDIIFNTTKTVFTGIFSRIEIMITKAISLIIWGIIFALIIEINNVVASCILYEKIGISGFLAFNHLELFITYIVIALCIGSLMFLISSIMFNESKTVLFFILFISMINFYTAGIVTLIFRHPEVANKLFIYLQTPFYNIVLLTQGIFNIKAVIINLAWTLIFFVSATFVINRREIK
ncbi:hypothetical protein SAMN02745163_00700 [Clostridium cavendishii DSM 21758]|uniref:ABC-2 type transport system permease protein n=1 Tax=Clostridium cavendishii DSM 21758 TaxID=1121302 RepID=A0A1M6DDQ8_9CLOT|nr:hypothetical protein [Clostridium cavendishii]SHI71396.1 hypothetical protein SAMN02745163_00700 [Clostridium cavendishii DSM 21758]